MGSMGLPTGASAAAHPVQQGTSTSGATKGQDLALPPGQDQRLMHPTDSRGVGQGGGHSHGVPTSTDSHEVADRCFTSYFMLCALPDRGVVALASELTHHVKAHNGSTAPKRE